MPLGLPHRSLLGEEIPHLGGDQLESHERHEDGLMISPSSTPR